MGPSESELSVKPCSKTFAACATAGAPPSEADDGRTIYLAVHY
jgi:hypothetical protein